MSKARLSETLYRMGELRSEPGTSNADLLRKLTAIAADATGTEVTAGIVYEDGIGTEPTACAVVGALAAPKSPASPPPFLDGQGRRVLRQLAACEPEQLYSVDELVGEPDALPLTAYRIWLARFERADGAEFIFAIGIRSDADAGRSATLARANIVAQYIGRTWKRVWTREPEWLRQLRPAARNVLSLVVQGYDDEQISEMTGLTYHSVRAHLKRLFREANVRSRLHLIQASQRAWTTTVEPSFQLMTSAGRGFKRSSNRMVAAG